MSRGDGDPFEAIVLLESLSPEERSQLAKECRFQKYTRGQTIFTKDSENRDVMFVLRGSVKVIDYSLAGKEISFAEVEAGGHFGELAAIDDQPRSASVTAVTDSELAALPPARFSELLREHPEVGSQVMRRMAAIIRRSTERLMDFTTLNAHQRLCSELMRMAQPSPAVPGAWVIAPIPTQAVIASRLGTSRETVARILSELVKGGLLVRKGRTVTIPDRDRLELLVQRLGDTT